MLRFGILSSVIPLVLAGGVAHDWTQASARQCAGLGAPSSRAIAFTDDPSLATVRVQIVDGAELADLAIADDNTEANTQRCGLQEAAQLLRISAKPVPGAPVVFLTHAADADYRLYLDSTSISVQQAAAMIVGARGGHTRLAAQPHGNGPTGSISR